MKTTKTVGVFSRPVPASYWKRFLAYVIDMLLVNLAVSIPFSKYFTKFEDNLDLILGSSNPSLFWLSVLAVLLIMFYFILLEYKTGQTLGKMLLNIYSVSLMGKKMGFNQAVIRNLTKPFPIVLLVDVAYMFFKGERRRLFEVFSGTAVVERGIVIK